MTVTTNSSVTGIGGGSTSGGVSQVVVGGGGTQVMFSNVSATGNSSTFTWTGGAGTFSAVGTFGSSVLTLNYLGPDGSTYLPAASLSAAGGVNFNLPVGVTLRATLTGGSPSGIYASVAS